MKGVEWLDVNGKRFDKSEDPARVNARWSKVLSERLPGIPQTFSLQVSFGYPGERVPGLS